MKAIFLKFNKNSIFENIISQTFDHWTVPPIFLPTSTTQTLLPIILLMNKNYFIWKKKKYIWLLDKSDEHDVSIYPSEFWT